MSENIACSLVTLSNSLENLMNFPRVKFRRWGILEVKLLLIGLLEIYYPSNFLFPQVIAIEVFLSISLRSKDEILCSII